MGTFENKLLQLSRDPNLMRGFVVGASAKLMAEQKRASTQILESLNKGLNSFDDTIKTTEEQLQALKQDPDGKSIIDNLTEQSSRMMNLTTNLIKREKEFGDKFNKSILALGIIGGEEADRSIKSLQFQKQEMMRRFAQLRNLPLKDLQYKALSLSLDFNAAKFRKYENDIEFKNRVDDIAGWISENVKEFDYLMPGNFKSFTAASRDAYMKNYSETLRKAKEHFKDKYNEDEILYGMREAMKLGNKSITFSNRPFWHNPNPNTNDEIKNFYYDKILNELRNLTIEYYNTPDDLKEQARDYFTTNNLPNSEKDAKRVKDFVAKFSPKGRYNTLLREAQTFDPALRPFDEGWGQYIESVERNEFDPNGQIIPDRKRKYLIFKDKYKKYNDIMLPQDERFFLNDRFYTDSKDIYWNNIYGDKWRANKIKLGQGVPDFSNLDEYEKKFGIIYSPTYGGF